MNIPHEKAETEDPLVQISFTPQVWINDHACAADPLGETEWKAPLSQVLALCDGALPEDDSYPSDDLRHLPSAPTWIQDWAGPFAVMIDNRDEIEAILEARAVDPQTVMGM